LKRKKSSGEYLAFISVKHELSPDMLFDALLTAAENGESKCGDLSIECRGKTKDQTIFLIMDGAVVVAQFSVSNSFLLQQGNPIRTFMETNIVRRYVNRETKPVKPESAIQDLRAGMNNVRVAAKVLEVTKPRLVVTRYGNNARLAEAVLADATGKIKLCLWNDQIDAVSAGATVQIENARVSMFSGERQLNLGKKGMLSNIENLESQPDVDGFT